MNELYKIPNSGQNPEQSSFGGDPAQMALLEALEVAESHSREYDPRADLDPRRVETVPDRISKIGAIGLDDAKAAAQEQINPEKVILAEISQLSRQVVSLRTEALSRGA